jgi:hypothetical protein
MFMTDNGAEFFGWPGVLGFPPLTSPAGSHQ